MIHRLRAGLTGNPAVIILILMWYAVEILALILLRPLTLQPANAKLLQNQSPINAPKKQVRIRPLGVKVLAAMAI
ncbi:hypothetical protein DNK10_17785 [Pseudomonas daroniae]|nr:hypothetical protein DNK10_17785 [Pseudomonas daroniae]